MQCLDFLCVVGKQSVFVLSSDASLVLIHCYQCNRFDPIRRCETDDIEGKF